MLNGADELARFEQAVMCASIEPSITAAPALNVQRAHFHVEPVQIGDLQFTTGRRADLISELANAIVVEIKSGYCRVGTRLDGITLDRKRLALPLEPNHPIATGVTH